MADRLYCWPCDGASAGAYSAPPLYPLPPSALCVDSNNNTGGSLRYFTPTPPPPGLLQQQPKFGSANPSNNCAYAAAPSVAPHLVVCQYAHANGSASCYNRNRYMPYSHNRSCAAAAAAAAVASATGCPLMLPQSYQPYTPIYQQTNMTQQALPQVLSTATGGAAIVSAGIGISGASAVSSVGTTISNLNGNGTGNITAAVNPSTAGLAEFTFGNAGLINTMAPSAAICCNTAASTTTSSATALNNCSAAAPMSGNNGQNQNHSYASVSDPNDAVTLQITNLDYTLDENSLRNFLMSQLKPITPVVSLVFEGSSYAKVTVPDLYFAKQVVSNLHRKKNGHKRMLVSYTRDSSLTEVNTLRCQVAGLLKDVPYYTLPMYKFRELFQSRFKTSISVLDLYKMQDICTINSDNNEEKFISLQPELVNSLESSPLMEGLQHSVPYCTVHFKREQHKGWAEQEIEPLPNVCMTIAEIQQMIYPLLKHHPGDIPVATLVHCIEGQLNAQITANENGVNLEHLVCCVQGIQIQMNNFGIKILGWQELNKETATPLGGGPNSSANANLTGNERGSYFKNSVADPLHQISREVIELVKMSPKSTMKFNRFIPAYHNHFGKQCRVADYGYTKLIELFEALSSVVQIMGGGENRQITLTHRQQVRRFTSDLLRVLRAHGNNSVLLSQLPGIFAQTQNRNFDVTDYGVCDIVDILDGLVNSNIVVVSSVQQGKDILISIPKRKQTNNELERTCVFAGEMVELFQNALQYTILFQKFVRSYHYHFAYQCRLSDYGFMKLADLMDAIHGVVEMEQTNDEDKKIYLSPKVARRVFAKQCEDLIRTTTGHSTNCMKLEQVLKLHKKKYGYQMQPQTLGVSDIASALKLLPYVELVQKEDTTWLICHHDDLEFRQLCYRACKQLLLMERAANNNEVPTRLQFLREFNAKYQDQQLSDSLLLAMRHAIEIYTESEQEFVRLSAFMRFLVSIVRQLEHRSSMYLHELKSAMECGIATTFEFGYPNLYSLIAAHEDLFIINIGSTQERSDVALNANCELRLSSSYSHQHLFGSLKMPFAKQKARAARLPLGEQQQHNRPPLTQAPPPHKSMRMANDYVNSSTVCSAASIKPQLNPTGNLVGYQQESFACTTQKCSPPFASNIQPNANSSTLSSSLLNNSCSSAINLSLCRSCSNKENSLNNSLQFFNSSFSSSGELSGSADLSNITCSTASRLWHRRQTSYYQQQQHQQLTDDLYDLVDCNVTPISSIYEPPKPDTPTPPKKKLPFWIDPIWSNNAISGSDMSKNNNLLDIRLPESKSHNVWPMLLSPYTISKHENMKRQLFNFENHDRKIA